MYQEFYLTVDFSISLISYGNSQDAPPLTNGLRKCGIYTQWNFMQP
jgi:hypothetical protein